MLSDVRCPLLCDALQLDPFSPPCLREQPACRPPWVAAVACAASACFSSCPLQLWLDSKHKMDLLLLLQCSLLTVWSCCAYHVFPHTCQPDVQVKVAAFTSKYMRSTSSEAPQQASQEPVQAALSHGTQFASHLEG